MSVVPLGSARRVGRRTKLTSRSTKENPITIPIATARNERMMRFLKSSRRSSIDTLPNSELYPTGLREALGWEKGTKAITSFASFAVGWSDRPVVRWLTRRQVVGRTGLASSLEPSTDLGV